MKKFKKWLLSIAVVAAILGSGIALSTPQAYMDLVIKKISIPKNRPLIDLSSRLFINSITLVIPDTPIRIAQNKKALKTRLSRAFIGTVFPTPTILFFSLQLPKIPNN
ncbi:hypothetical protein P7H25_23745 [Paenibacillus larvae]|nr:hypothetical protein [Paenibacillus larvae]MDT2257945.1 hypothetical protein [Paenibacillus larvae]